MNILASVFCEFKEIYICDWLNCALPKFKNLHEGKTRAATKTLHKNNLKLKGSYAVWLGKKNILLLASLKNEQELEGGIGVR
jgi:hypothetical protein